MINFKIGTQIEKELEDFRTARVRLAHLRDQNETVRFAKKKVDGYYYNQHDTICAIDLAYNSQFDSGPLDKNKQRKIYMNIGKFRCDVSSKQIELDTKDGKFIPDDYANPWVAVFLQKDFKEWAKEKKFGEDINTYVENFPRYGTIVAKKVGRDLKPIPLQNLINEQTADSLQTASYVIEQHPDMLPWEIDQMKNWDKTGLTMKYNERIDVYERYGYVPLKWLNQAQGNTENIMPGDENTYVDAVVIVGKIKKDTNTNQPWHVFYASQITSRPYREAHWSRQHGRWLGIGVMEDQLENQTAKNIIVNLIRRSMHWSSKKIFQSSDSNIATKSLSRDVPDGGIVEIGPQGEIREIVTASRNQGEYQQFLNEFEKNSDQKAFTYEVATGESMASGTPFRLGVLLNNAVNSFFAAKRERLGLFLESAVNDFLVPQFLKDMQNKERVISMFSDEPGFEILKKAAMDFVKGEAARVTLLSGKPVDANAIEAIVQPFQEIQSLFFNMSKQYYNDVKFKFSFTFTGEAEDVAGKIETLKTIYQLLAQQGDSRAEKVLARITALSGENMAQFGSPTTPQIGPGNPQTPPAPPGSPMSKSPATPAIAT
jgi:hypothetical protein